LMLRSKVKICFLLGYLVLLFNFGPSLHHAPIFGLHGLHHHGSDISISENACCCGHSHSPANKSHSSDPLGSFDEDFQHDCAFCKFFDEYNVVIASFECTDVESPISLFVAELTNSATAAVVPKTARGPPIA